MGEAVSCAVYAVKRKHGHLSEGACEPPLANSPLPVSFSALPTSSLPAPNTCPSSGLRAQTTKEVWNSLPQHSTR